MGCTDNIFNRCKATDPFVAAGQQTFGGFYEVGTTFAQHLDVVLGRWVLPHLSVHRRGDENGCASCKRDGSQGVVGKAVSHRGQNIRRRRCNQK